MEEVRRTRRHQEEAACELYSSLKVRRWGGGESWEPWEVCETREGWGVVRERQAEPLARETFHLEGRERSVGPVARDDCLVLGEGVFCGSVPM